MFMDVTSYISQQCLLESKGFIKQHCLTDLSWTLAKIFFFLPDWPTHFNERERDGKQNILGGMASLLKFYNIIFTFSLRRFEDTGEKSPRDCVILPTPPLGVYLHINFKTQTHLSWHIRQSTACTAYLQ